MRCVSCCHCRIMGAWGVASCCCKSCAMYYWNFLLHNNNVLLKVQGQNYIVLICTLKYKTGNNVRLGPFLMAQKDRNMYQLFLQKILAGRSHLSYFHVVWDEKKITIH
ncbi:hypothetical protein BDA96_02G099100 [Sorghum bicolor]|uniref:Secreted protein n=1 Tax=Sorghum bicolor TaxID=4558 RepID=A0A921RNQ6_SORBI|nr:hypothetical protein BDA96_02G099100 [Sorghum bicolor]